MYQVSRSGYRGIATSKSGETLYVRGLYPKCDYDVLHSRLEAAKAKGEIISFSIEWITVQEVIK